MAFLLSASQANTMKWPLLDIGTLVVATRNVGPVTNGQLGIVMGTQFQQSFFWKRPVYRCTFVGNIKAVMKPNEVVEFDRENV